MGGAVSPEWYLSQVCEEFQIPPSVALEEDSQLISDILIARRYARAKELIERDDTDEETIRKSGLSEALVELVMQNIERQNA